VGHGRVKGGGVLATAVVGLVLMLGACTAPNQVSSNSPDSSPSSDVVSTPTPTPTPPPPASPVSTPPVVVPSPPSSLTMGSLPFHAGEVGVAYSPVALNASGGTAPYTWSIGGGFIPAGLYLTADGFAGGQPTTAGTYTATIRVDDSAGASTSVPATIVIVPHLSATGLCTKFCIVEQGCDTVCGQFGTKSGGLPPYKYKVTAGSLPFGMGLSGLSLTGVFPAPPFSGDITNVDVIHVRVPFGFSVSVTDSLGVAKSVSAVFAVFPHIAFSNPATTCTGFGCEAVMPYTLGTPGGTAEPAISSIVCSPDVCTGTNGRPSANNLPDGFSVSVDSANQQVLVDFPGGEWVGTVLLTISDQSLCGVGGAHCSASQTIAVSTNAG
jgi:hypothetical protein